MGKDIGKNVEEAEKLDDATLKKLRGFDKYLIYMRKQYERWESQASDREEMQWYKRFVSEFYSARGKFRELFPDIYKRKK